MDGVFYEPHDRDPDLLPHDPFKALVAPRPVGWISTRGASGEVNLAPYSFFNAVAERPPMVMFSSDGLKDSISFALETGEFVWNLATWDLREAMNESSAEIPRGHSEFDRAGLELADCRLVSAPRVAASPCAFECRLVQFTELPPSQNRLVVGEVVGIHLADGAVGADGLVDTAALRPVARCGYRGEYAVVDELFTMLRPTA